VLIDRDESARDLTERSRHGSERADHKHHAARIDGAGDAAKGHEAVREGEGCAAHEACEHGDARGRAIHVLTLLEKVLRKVAMPAEQIVGQDVSAHFLRGSGLGQEVAQIVTLPFLGRLFVEKLIQFRGDAAFDRERQERRAESQQDQDEVKACKQSRHEQYGDDVP
jgi:hypothetical protein